MPPEYEQKDFRPSVWGAEDIEANKKAFIGLHQTNQVNIFVGKLVSLGLIGLIVFLLIAILRVTATNGHLKPMIVRINDVGAAEAVRIDTDWIPEEGALREALGRLVERMYTRNGFETPKAIDINALYLADDAYRKWKAEVLAELPTIADGRDLARVRILRCDVESPANSITESGTTAHIRYATDEVRSNGAPIPGTAIGWEMTFQFRVGAYPQNFTGRDGAQKKEQWVTRNPLGLKVLTVPRLTRYFGEDVADKNMEVQVKEIEAKMTGGNRSRPYDGDSYMTNF